MKKESAGIWILYKTVLGRCILKLLVRPGFSRMMGRYLDSPSSKWLICRYIRKYRIDMKEYIETEYTSFNSFFTRKRKMSVQVLDGTPEHLISPCDGFLTVYPIEKEGKYWIKNVEYSTGELLQDEQLAEKYRGGFCFVFRLTPQNYHRYCYVDDGIEKRRVCIDGVLHSVCPLAYGEFPVFVQNSRVYTLIETINFGRMIQMEVGALLVGKIHNYCRTARVFRGDEKGYFEFGGSTIILLFEKGQTVPDKRFMENTLKGNETSVRLGERIASKKSIS